MYYVELVWKYFYENFIKLEFLWKTKNYIFETLVQKLKLISMRFLFSKYEN